MSRWWGVIENWRAEHGVNAGLVALACMHGLNVVDLVVSLDNVRNEEVAFLDIVYGVVN